MRFTIKDNRFPVDVKVYINLTEEQLLRVIRRAKLPEEVMDAWDSPGFVVNDHRGTIYMFFHDMPMKLNIYATGVIAHECCHATFATMDHIGESPTGAEETFCYHTEYLTTTILTKINNKYKNECKKRDQESKKENSGERCVGATASTEVGQPRGEDGGHTSRVVLG